jgi:cyclophilin family peptidyl-prolyl cis-trans isomerase
MTRRAILAVVGLVTAVAGLAAQSKGAPPPAGPVVVIDTAKGAIEVELYQQEAPKSVEHFLTLVRRDFYRGQRFHWVQPGIVQVGDPRTRNMAVQDSWGKGGSGQAIGVAEISKRPWDRGTVGLAYFYSDPKEADSQFFINKAPNPALAGKYTMLGHVVKGMDVVDKLERADMLKTVTVKGDPPK